MELRFNVTIVQESPTLTIHYAVCTDHVDQVQEVWKSVRGRHRPPPPPLVRRSVGRHLEVDTSIDRPTEHLANTRSTGGARRRVPASGGPPRNTAGQRVDRTLDRWRDTWTVRGWTGSACRHGMTGTGLDRWRDAWTVWNWTVVRAGSDREWLDL